MLEVGTIAPAFTLSDQYGNPVSLSEYRGRKVVLYFYPRDNTPGCAREAVAFARAYENFKSRDMAIIGISKDSVASHRYDIINLRFDLGENTEMSAFSYVTLRERPEIKDAAAVWFHTKWGIPQEAYLACMDSYLNHETEYGWFLCLDEEKIIAGLGVIENDFHDRKDLSPNICAVYTEDNYRRMGIAGELLNMAVSDLKAKGISPVYLLTDHTGFYERYGWEFLCMVQGDGETEMSRMYLHY